jgi:hypothetical protein
MQYNEQMSDVKGGSIILSREEKEADLNNNQEHKQITRTKKMKKVHNSLTQNPCKR